MNDKKITSKSVDEIIDGVSAIDKVKTPPFFKDRVLQQLASVDENRPFEDWLTWFTPKYQIAVICIFLVLNFSVLYTYMKYSQEEKIEAFAKAYGLTSSQDDYFIN